MKLSIEVDCTPEEARAFLGLPDVRPLNEGMVEEMRKRMESNMAMLAPEELMKSWMAFGGQATEQFRKMMTTAANSAMSRPAPKSMTDTIFALATAPGRGAVAVIRLSGPGSGRIAGALAGRPPPPRQAGLRTLRNTAGEILDHALVLWFPAPASYTGEDCAELHLHGGPAVVDAVTRALIDAGARLAEPGEFTRRAFENGRLDLAEAEAVADLVEAETAGQARQALRQMEGALGERYDRWRDTLIEALGTLEAGIDFAEEDAGAALAASARPALERLEHDLAQAVADQARGRRVREGYRIAVIGAPNAGKSSLVNALAEREVAIVHARAGTTRDVLEAPLTLAGYRAILSDTAGLRDTGDEIEQEGARRAARAARRRRPAPLGRGRRRLRRKLARRHRPRPPRRPPPAEQVRPPARRRRPRSPRLWQKNGATILEISTIVPGLIPPRRASDDGEERSHRRLAVLMDALEIRIAADLTGTDFPAATRQRHADLLARRWAASGRRWKRWRPRPRRRRPPPRRARPGARHRPHRRGGRAGPRVRKLLHREVSAAHLDNIYITPSSRTQAKRSEAGDPGPSRALPDRAHWVPDLRYAALHSVRDDVRWGR